MQEPNEEIITQLKLMNVFLEDIATSFNKFVEEGITIYMHEGGEETKN